jgi:hypothetical protein
MPQPVNPTSQLPAAPAAPPAPAAPIVPVSASGAASAAQNVAPPVKHARAPRKMAASSNASVNSVPDMYMLVSTSTMSTVNRHTLNTFVPSAIVMMHVLRQMNHLMCTTHRFLQGAQDWSPYLSLAYFGNLFIIQALRAYREVNPLPMHEEWILSGIESTIGLDSLMIPGPLVPMFQAIAASCSPYEWLGNVAPSVLNITRGCNQNTDFMLQNGMNRILPQIPTYLDMIHRFRSIPAGADLATRQTILIQFYRSVFQVDCTVNDVHFTRALGIPARPFDSVEFIPYVNGANNLDLPTRLNRNGADATDLNLAQYMGFYDAPTVANGRYHNWFNQAAGIHARYAQFFKDSVPLSAITPSGIGASLVLSTYAANPTLQSPGTFHAAVAAAAPAPAVRAYYTLNELTSLSIVATHGDEKLEEQAEQCAMLSAVNVDVETSSGMTSPTNANLRTGEVWTLPTVRRSPNVDIAPGIYARIVASYHEDTRRTN